MALPQFLLFAISDCSETVIKNALAICDIALAMFSKKTEIARLQFLHWDRRGGTAVGAFREHDAWKPMLRPNRKNGPAIVFPPELDFWDVFLGNAIRSSLSELGDRLFKCLEWEREG